MQRGWSAEGRLAPLYDRVGGRAELARLTGIGETTLSGYNSGDRPLGMVNAKKIAGALDVSLYDLGAPLPEWDDFAASLLGQSALRVIQNPPRDDPDLLEEFASLLDRAAAVLREVAADSRSR